MGEYMSKKMKKPSTKVKNIKTVKKKPVIIGSLICVALIAIIAIFIIVSNGHNSTIEELCNNSWIPMSANDASGDEVELSEVYNTNYSSYQGSMSFREDGTFSLWLSPGNADDGTHSGKYKVEDSSIKVTFDEGTQTEFGLIYDMDFIESIKVYYNGYEVYFVKQKV